MAIAGLCLEGFRHRRMDYPTPRLMGFHFAKHLSPLVLASEHEMNSDSAVATAVFRWVSWVPCQACSTRVARGGSHWMRGCWEPFRGTSGCSCHPQQPCAGTVSSKVSSGPQELCWRHFSRLDVGVSHRPPPLYHRQTCSPHPAHC